MTIAEIAPAKINLALHVRRRRPDGYHDLETLFAFCRDGDRIIVDDAAAPAFTVTGPFAEGLGGDDNLVVRAVAVFGAAFGIHAAHRITLDKHLPVASGIGGGSADAAATLRALARRHGVARDDARLFAVAAMLGADVPACLLGRTSLGTGRGDVLEPVAGVPDLPVLLVNPRVAVSTAAIFRAWDGIDRGPISGDSAMARAMAGRNDLQPAAIGQAPVIRDVLDLLEGAQGVRLARMSGSGATCFALFDTPDARARAAMAAFARGWWTLESTLGE